jgi:hypothetical protein
MITYQPGIRDDPEAITLGAPWRDEFEPEFIQHGDKGGDLYLSVTFTTEEERVRILFTPEEAALIGRQLVEWRKSRRKSRSDSFPRPAPKNLAFRLGVAAG